jgi:hypothetical protein
MIVRSMLLEQYARQPTAFPIRIIRLSLAAEAWAIIPISTTGELAERKRGHPAPVLLPAPNTPNTFPDLPGANAGEKTKPSVSGRPCPLRGSAKIQILVTIWIRNRNRSPTTVVARNLVAARTLTVPAIDATSAVVSRSAALVCFNMVDLLNSLISTIPNFANLLAVPNDDAVTAHVKEIDR